MNKFKQKLDKFIGNYPLFKEPIKRKFLMKMKKENKASGGKGIGPFKYAAMLVLLMAVGTLFSLLALNENISVPSTSTQENPVLTDAGTEAIIQLFTEYEEPLEVFDFKYDSMDRGNHDYTEYPLLIDPQPYTEKEIARGDVIVYEAEFFNGMQRTVGRVIGLPGETVEIIDGQIYINGRKLDTFYGRAHRVGISSNAEYNKVLIENGATQNIDPMKEIFSQNTREFQLAEGEIFVVGDDWFRGSQHRLPVSEIQAEVLGYYQGS
ncbi:signal peptidase I [Planococcus shenhongbingii]|uniref:Signal peptidase I n=1 Tax=Planococcus shenhongbingii TaxID=3058398 RepID=A0ABT8NGQ6_9BACL|nr:signal peptidase I [Planococcus sp. N017]MDN7246904.1 signal peptidase I [Planococcus sp. N017]